jgi:hypothetical protein
VLFPQEAVDEPFAPGLDYHSDAPAGSAGRPRVRHRPGYRDS